MKIVVISGRSSLARAVRVIKTADQPLSAASVPPMKAVMPRPGMGGVPHRSGAKRRAVLGVGALGVVFGDIGTSPLYAFQDIFAGVHPIEAIEPRVLGAVSLVFWTLTLVVSFKYVLIVMRADNDGEGGVIALAALAVRSGIRTARGRMVLMGLGILGAALFYGDGMITPAISVLSAVEGLEVAAPGLSSWVLPAAIVVLVLLFLAQRHGTARVGMAFGPIMFIWFIAIGVFGLLSLIQTPHVLAAISPGYAISFIAAEPLLAFFALGSVVLCVTGAEALYADMGQFGRAPIRMSWFAIVTPALYLTYFGQAALVIRDPKTAVNPFYLMVPGALQWPMVILATIATVIASQAVISGAFSMTRQAMRLDYLPRMTVKHTSATERGQIYVPAVNWFLMVAVLVLIVGFRSSDNLASAYGIAVTGTFVITTTMITFVARRHWRVSGWIVFPVAGVLFVIDMAFFLSNLTKFEHGGWFPLVVAFVIFVLLTTWRRGQDLMRKRMAALSPPLADFAREVARSRPTVVPGTAVYTAIDSGSAPYALVQHAKLLHVIAEQSIIVRVHTVGKPRTAPEERVSVSQSVPGFTQVDLHYGFMERPDIQSALATVATQGVAIDPATTTYIVHFATVEPSPTAQMWMPRQVMYVAMNRLSIDPPPFMSLPVDRVLEVGTIVRL